MALLSEAERQEIWRALMRRWSRNSEVCSISKADLRAAVDAMDQFLEDNAAAVNAAIPQPARAELSVPQKALLLMYTTWRRYGETPPDGGV